MGTSELRPIWDIYERPRHLSKKKHAHKNYRLRTRYMRTSGKHANLRFPPPSRYPLISHKFDDHLNSFECRVKQCDIFNKRSNHSCATLSQIFAPCRRWRGRWLRRRIYTNRNLHKETQFLCPYYMTRKLRMKLLSITYYHCRLWHRERHSSGWPCFCWFCAARCCYASLFTYLCVATDLPCLGRATRGEGEVASLRLQTALKTGH